jgi:hypothetical protein
MGYASATRRTKPSSAKPGRPVGTGGLGGWGQLGWNNLQLHQISGPTHPKRQAPPHPRTLHCCHQLGGVSDELIIHCNNHISLLQSCPGRRRGSLNRHNPHPLIKCSAIPCSNYIETYTDNWVVDTTSTNQLAGNIAGPIYWNSKSQARQARCAPRC